VASESPAQFWRGTLLQKRENGGIKRRRNMARRAVIAQRPGGKRQRIRIRMTRRRQFVFVGLQGASPVLQDPMCIGSYPFTVSISIGSIAEPIGQCSTVRRKACSFSALDTD